jgi:uncharacterized Fe-S cluster-containing protein
MPKILLHSNLKCKLTQDRYLQVQTTVTKLSTLPNHQMAHASLIFNTVGQRRVSWYYEGGNNDKV